MTKRLTPVCWEYWVAKGQTEDEAKLTIKRLQSERSSKRERKYKDAFLPGTKFRNWTVIDGVLDNINASGRKTSAYIYVRVKCDCGTESKVSGTYLLRGRSTCCRSCSEKATGYIGVCGPSNSKWSGYRELTGTLIARIRAGAKNRNLEFLLDAQSLYELYQKQNGKCALSGVPLSWDDASLDRINSMSGYVPGNVQWVTKRVNIMKHTMTVGELLDICREIVIYNDAI